VALNIARERSEGAPLNDGVSDVLRRGLMWYGPLACIVCHWGIDWTIESQHAAGWTADNQPGARGRLLPPALYGVPIIRQAADVLSTSFGQRLPARVALALCAVAVMRVFFNPLRSPARLHGVSEDPSSGGVVVRLSAEWVIDSLTSPFAALAAVFVWGLFLLLDGPAVPGALLVWLQMCAFLRATQTGSVAGGSNSIEYVKVGAWFLLTIGAFYSTGHQPTFPTVQWASGLVGVGLSHTHPPTHTHKHTNTHAHTHTHKHTHTHTHTHTLHLHHYHHSHSRAAHAPPLPPTHPLTSPLPHVSLRYDSQVGDGWHAVSATLIAFNTWGTYAALAASLPMLVVLDPKSTWGIGNGAGSATRGEGWVGAGGPGLQRAVLAYQLLFSATTLLSMSAAAMHRRHLMVWKIFAPRVIFDCAALVISSAFTVIGLVLARRVTRELDSAVVDRVREVSVKTR
jgi:hypothetical protein